MKLPPRSEDATCIPPPVLDTDDVVIRATDYRRIEHEHQREGCPCGWCHYARPRGLRARLVALVKRIW